MQEKQLLITSMQKLIKHIGTNKKNQQDIFKSLSKVDITKIVSNLEDASTDLRKISFELIVSLLFDNYALKKQFCQKIGVGEINGRIILNPKILSSISIGIKDIVTLLKQPLKQQQSSYTVWYVNPSNYPRKLEYLNQNNKSIDPKQNIVGIVYSQPSINLLKEGPMINNLVQNTRQSQNNKYTVKSSNNSQLNSYSGSFQSYSKRQPGYSHNYTANTINNYNTHNNYYTIVPGSESPMKNQVYGVRQLRDNQSQQQSKDSLKDYKKDAPISIKKLNAYTGRTYGVKQHNTNISMHQSVQIPIDRNYNQVNKTYMAMSNIGNSFISHSPGYNMTHSVEEQPSPLSPYLHNRNTKPISVIMREPERLANRSEITSDRNSQPHYQNSNSPHVPQLEIKNKFLQAPIQSVPDRSYTNGVNNSFKFNKKY